MEAPTHGLLFSSGAPGSLWIFIPVTCPPCASCHVRPWRGEPDLNESFPKIQMPRWGGGGAEASF